MDLSNETLVGAAVLAFPMLILASIFMVRRQLALGLFVDALMIVGIGYLVVTGAAADIGAWALDMIGQTSALDTGASTDTN